MRKIRGWWLGAGLTAGFALGVPLFIGSLAAGYDELLYEAARQGISREAVAAMSTAVVFTASTVWACLAGVVGLGIGTILDIARQSRDSAPTGPATTQAPESRRTGAVVSTPGSSSKDVADGARDDEKTDTGPTGSPRYRRLQRARRGQAAIILGTTAAAYLGLLFGYAANLGLLGPIGQVWVVPSSPALTYVIGSLWMLFTVGAALTVLRCPGWWFSLRRWPWSSRTPPPVVVVGALGAVLCGVVASDILERVLGEWGLINTGDGAGIDTVAGWIDAVIWITAEELLVVAIPVTVMRYLRVPTPWALLVAVILGLVPYLYLGHIGIWTMLPWVTAAAAVYWRWPSVTVLAGLIAIAIAYNVGLTVGGSYSLVLFGGVGLVALVVAFELERRWYRHVPVASTPTVSLCRRRQS